VLFPPTVLTALRAAAARGTDRRALLGAYVLAEAGLLDGRTAVTHWRWADDFAARFPSVTLDRAPLYIDHGDVVTSAAARPPWTAACTWCAATTVLTPPPQWPARWSPRRTAPVAGPVRAYPPAATVSTVSWAKLAGRRGRRQSAWCGGVADLVAHTRISRRSLERHFRDQLGTTPRAWLTDRVSRRPVSCWKRPG